MPRPVRIQYPGAIYHVFNRGNNRNSIFFNVIDMRFFIKLLGEACNVFACDVLAYCLMTNHYHILIQTTHANLDKVMHFIGTKYTQSTNIKHKRIGHLFGGRYKSILVQEQEYIANLVRYIHLNPVEAELVDDPIEWDFSSHRQYLGGDKKIRCLNLEKGMAIFGGSVEAYTEFINDGVDEMTEAFYSNKIIKSVFGSESFQDEAGLRNESLHCGDDVETILLKQKDSSRAAKQIVDLVSYSFAQDEKAIFETSKGKANLPLAIAMDLLRDTQGFSYEMNRKYFGLKSKGAVKSQLRRFATRRNNSPPLDDLHTGLIKVSENLS